MEQNNSEIHICETNSCPPEAKNDSQSVLNLIKEEKMIKSTKIWLIIAKKLLFFWFLLICSIYILHAKPIHRTENYEATIFTSNADVNSPNQIWNFSSLNFYRNNKYGAFGGNINYANRFDLNAFQGYLNILPKFDGFWFDLGYGYANKPELFPNNTVVTEFYKKFGNTIFSIGNNYRTIQNTYFNTFTGSIETYVKNYAFGFRPYHFVPKNGPHSTLFKFSIKKYADNPDQYLGLIFATGTSPDLYDLLLLNFLKVKNNIYLIQGQQPINEHLFFLYGAGYETQKYPNNFMRRLTYFNTGIKLRIT